MDRLRQNSRRSANAASRFQAVTPASGNGSVLDPLAEGNERAVLLYYFNTPDAFAKLPVLPDDFALPAHRIMFGGMQDVYDEGEPINNISVSKRLREKGELKKVGRDAAITSIFASATPSSFETAEYALELMRDASVKRGALKIVERFQKGETELDEAIDQLQKVNAPRERIPLIKFRSPLQLKNFTPPPGLVLVGDFHIVRGSVFVIGGAPGVGKSRASVALAEAGATGHEWFGLTIHRKFKTMIVQTENGEFRLAREFAELDCETLENFVRVCPPPPYGLCFGRSDFREQLRAHIYDFMPDAVIYDPWNAAAREQDSREYLDTFEALKSVLPLGDNAPAFGIVAHTRKPKADDRASGRALLNLLAGSYVLGSVPRTAFVMQAASDDTTDNRIVWTCCKNNDGEPGLRSAWERCNGLFVPVADFDWEKFDASAKDARVKITAEHVQSIFEGRPLRKGEAVERLIELTGASQTTCYDALKLDGRFAGQLRMKKGTMSWVGD